jgi:hypothetical protein
MEFGALALHSPWIETDDGTDNLMMKGAAASAFRGFMLDKSPSVRAVWRGEVRPSRIVSAAAALDDSARFYSPSGGAMKNGAAVTAARDITDVLRDISGLSRKGEPIPRILVLDSEITGSDAQAEMFLAFLLQQGIRLDLWAVSRPSPLSMCRISRITQGRTYYSEDVGAIPPRENVEWTLRLPLPPDITTFGYPSDATLSIFSEIDSIRFADWIPVWPSLITRLKTEKGAEK